MRKFKETRKAVDAAIIENNVVIDQKRAAMNEAVELAAAARAEADMAFDSDVSPLDAAALEITAKRNEKAAEVAKAEFEKAEKIPAFGGKGQYDSLIREAIASRIDEASQIGEELRAAIMNVEAITAKLKHIDSELAELAEVIRRNSDMSKEEFESGAFSTKTFSIYGYYCSQSVTNAVKDIEKTYEQKIKPNLRA